MPDDDPAREQRHDTVVVCQPPSESAAPLPADQPTVSPAIQVRSAFRAGALFCFYVAFAVIFQALTGAYQAEFAEYPDEPSHVVGGLMVRDYIAHGLPAPPIEYAEAYYERYPKVALGHWPPVFYLVQAGWTLLFGVSRTSILVLMAVITSSLALLLAREIGRIFGPWPGVLAGSVLIAIPQMQHQTAQVMPEVLLTVFAFVATVQFSRYLDTGHWRHSVAFAVLASLCILTKGTGWALALVPPAAILITRRVRLCIRPSLWAAAGVVALLCIPWYVLAARFVRHVWIGSPGSTVYPLLNALNTGSELTRIAGWAGMALVAAGCVAFCTMPVYHRGAAGSLFASMFALLIAIWVFTAGVPLEVEARKLIIAVPPMIIMAALGTCYLSRFIPARWRRVAPVLFLVPAIAFVPGTFPIPRKANLGFVDAATVALTAAPPFIFLVSASAAGEGAFIAELAMRETDHRCVVLRASKTLASMDWNGNHYHALFHTPEEIDQYLDRRSVSLIVVEDLPASEKRPDQFMLEQMLRERPFEWVPAEAPRQANFAPSQTPKLCCARARVFRRALVNPPGTSEVSWTMD